MNLSKKQVDEAVAPTNSQQKIALSEYIRRHARIRPFGEDFCIYVDNQLEFVSTDKKLLHPTVEIPTTGVILGMEACFETRIIVLMSHDYPEKSLEAVIKLDFYSVDKNFNVSLVRTESTPAECRSTNITFHFSSPKIGEYVGLFADFFNYDWFRTIQVCIGSNSGAITTARRVEFDSCVLPLEEWGDYAHKYIFPGLGCLYNPDVYPVLKHPNCVFLIVRSVSLQQHNAPKTRVFESAVRLPVAVHDADTLEDYHRGSAMMVKIDQMVQHSDGTDRALVRINTDYRQCVYLLLHMQNNTVLDMSIGKDKYEKKCIIDSSRDRIMRFVELPHPHGNEEKKTSEKKTSEKKTSEKEKKTEKSSKNRNKLVGVVGGVEDGVQTRGTKRKHG